MLNKLFFIKSVHTIIFFLMWLCLIYILYCGITRTYNWVLLLAIGAILIEGLALLVNRGRCPLATLAEKQGAESGSVTDIFLPQWIARNVFKVATGLFIAELVLLGLGYLFW
ncbi:hypothetical protein ACFLUO_02665 [Chloroflexota bacterium]